MPDASRAVAAVPHDDPAELYHAASKLEPVLAAEQLVDLRRFATQPALRQAACRPVRRHPYRDALALPCPAWPSTTLEAAVRSRRSASDLGGGDLHPSELALLLAAAYGLTGEILGPAYAPVPGRAAPSGGALFPLDLYVLPLRCPGIPCGVHLYDPERSELELVSAGLPAGRLEAALYQREVAATAAVLVVAVAVFARSRVKYGLRAYRHVLLEAGHAVQGALLAAAAAGLRALPLGGFVDRELEALLGVDGVRESVVHAFAAGREPATHTEPAA